jgi:hypothetical protein
VCGKKFGEVLTEVVEHRTNEPILIAEVPVNQTVVDPRTRCDVADGGCCRSAFGE